MAGAARIGRVILPVAELDRAASFYERLLGIEGRHVRGARHYLDCGGTVLVLAGPVRGCMRPQPPRDLLVFAVGDVDSVHARASALGCLVGELHDGIPAGEVATREFGERGFFADDPWGNRLCFVADETLFSGAGAPD